MSCPFNDLDEGHYIYCHKTSVNEVQCPLYDICQNDKGVNATVLDLVKDVVETIETARAIHDKAKYGLYV